jgi:hypothetical protein
MFFTCPHCGSGLYTSEMMIDRHEKEIEISYCRRCGRDIKEDYKDVLKELIKE